MTQQHPRRPQRRRRTTPLGLVLLSGALGFAAGLPRAAFAQAAPTAPTSLGARSGGQNRSGAQQLPATVAPIAGRIAAMLRFAQERSQSAPTEARASYANAARLLSELGSLVPASAPAGAGSAAAGGAATSPAAPLPATPAQPPATPGDPAQPPATPNDPATAPPAPAGVGATTATDTGSMNAAFSVSASQVAQDIRTLRQEARSTQTGGRTGNGRASSGGGTGALLDRMASQYAAAARELFTAQIREALFEPVSATANPGAAAPGATSSGTTTSGTTTPVTPAQPATPPPANP